MENNFSTTPLNRETLSYEYITNKLSITSIAKLHSVRRSLVYKLLVNYNIPRRTAYVNKKRYQKYCRCGNPIGFGNQTGFCRSCSCKERYRDKNNHPTYKGNSIVRVYDKGFNNTLRESIRLRDLHTCQECFAKQDNLDKKLDIHHIDYDKQNSSSDNLISLCHRCHMWTNSLKNERKELVIGVFKLIIQLNRISEILKHGNGKSDHIPEFSFLEEEMADLLIRVGDYCAANELRLEKAIIAKMAFNKTRPYKHDKQF